MKEIIACTGLQCPMKRYCIKFQHHIEKITKIYVMAEFEIETEKCRNFEYYTDENN